MNLKLVAAVFSVMLPFSKASAYMSCTYDYVSEGQRVAAILQVEQNASGNTLLNMRVAKTKQLIFSFSVQKMQVTMNGLTLQGAGNLDGVSIPFTLSHGKTLPSKGVLTIAGTSEDVFCRELGK